VRSCFKPAIYGNLFLKIGISQNGQPLIFGDTDFTIGFAALMFPIRCTTFVELCLQQMGDFYGNRMLQWTILMLGGWEL